MKTSNNVWKEEERQAGNTHFKAKLTKNTKETIIFISMKHPKNVREMNYYFTEKSFKKVTANSYPT